MKMLFPAIVAVVGIGLGTLAGQVLKPGPATAHAEKAEEGDSHGAKDDGHGKSDDHGKKDDHAKKEKKKKGAHGKSDAAADDVSYYKFSREFVVPVMENGTVTALVILHLYLEVDSEVSGGLFQKEPKLRDNIMTTLIEVGRRENIYDNLTNPESYETLRAAIADNLESVISEGLHGVLIVDFARQDM